MCYATLPRGVSAEFTPGTEVVRMKHKNNIFPQMSRKSSKNADYIHEILLKQQESSRRCSEAVLSLASGPRADSLPRFDSSLVQGASRLRYTDKAQMQQPGDMSQMALAQKKFETARI